MARSNGEDADEPQTKRRRLSSSNSIPIKTTNTRRKTACQACRLRKIKCDAVRPTCGICKASDAMCKYTDPLPEKLTIDSATDLLSNKLDRLQDDIEKLRTLVHQGGGSSIFNDFQAPTEDDRTSQANLTRQSSAIYTAEPSKDFLPIPAARTTADTVLTWPVYEGKYQQSALICVLFEPLKARSSGAFPSECDSFTVPGGLIPPVEESIPHLVDRFLENVHTKNPVCDVEELVRQSRLIAVNGLSWDAWSCLVLLACALGTIAKPFDAAVNVVPRASGDMAAETSWIADAPTTPRELQQAESCFVLACRRMGTLKHSILGSQCYFFAGVYLMYTMRPLLSWQYFTQSSILYQLHMKSTHGLVTDISALGQIPVQHDDDLPNHKPRRLEESMYWSCFKSESEFRVELPLPQSELATYYHPQMFPSPPSPADVEKAGQSNEEQTGLAAVNDLDQAEAVSLRQHAKQLCNEEESWYYYLTEIALRRIGNRIINTFFRQDPTAWLDIKPWLSIALEFDTQVSAWSAHLPAAMQHWETNYTIRAPTHTSLPDGSGNHVSRELSWATDNRLLEMRSWLYQPFLYYFIHNSTLPKYPPHGRHESTSPLSPTATTTSRQSPTITANTTTTTPPTLETFLHTTPHLQTETHLSTPDITSLYHFITSGIDCNLKILDVRSLRHRHHGLWYDMRSLMCASLILLAVVRSGHEAWIPGGVEVLWGGGVGDGDGIQGRIGHIIDEFGFWAEESPDMVRHAEVLREVTGMVRAGWRNMRANGEGAMG
ncbi:hypothetical protein BDY17DRAFT_321070 [Neohortaea acidophila]|uniref:Zn(2)-C6 fungal-type domain-containing protein n=1 Tax=Neohortaea acidophila TaxID=245834 RepID=A0A6A6Q1B0_9PEZI|nr:uncharacterized protein BDY17DRAFT_321070 [Neohortaea acidophila]KAF2486258.1 hypothetical protein BDY17DRAFT_321070 [Neohortaea acidophila]